MEFLYRLQELLKLDKEFVTVFVSYQDSFYMKKQTILATLKDNQMEDVLEQVKEAYFDGKINSVSFQGETYLEVTALIQVLEHPYTLEMERQDELELDDK